MDLRTVAMLLLLLLLLLLERRPRTGTGTLRRSRTDIRPNRWNFEYASCLVTISRNVAKLPRLKIFYAKILTLLFFL